MRHGVNIIHYAGGANAKSLVRWAEFAEDVGYDFALISDHVGVTSDVEEIYPPPFFEALTSLAYLAGKTTRLHLGTSVLVVPYRHPLLAARMIATIDQLSGGRLILGVGSGWAAKEFRALGIDHAQRGAITDEYLEVMRRVWTTERTSFDGSFVSFTDVATQPSPLQRPGPPIWVGGNSPRAMRRAIELGDAWHPIWPRVKWLSDIGIPRLQELAESVGNDVPAVAPRIFLRLTDHRVPDEGRYVGHGTVAQVSGDLDGLEHLGIEHVLFDTYDRESHQSDLNHEYHLRTLERVAHQF